MRINHNITAMNTYRQLSINDTNSSKSMEKLSSGYRINRAADDAAGLSISEKMRAQIRGLNQATRNAQDGISYIQTAEGALNEVSDMLVRLKELAVQGSNGTYDSADTGNIGLEVSQLTDEITNILTNTKFNGNAVFSAGTGVVSIAIDDQATIFTVGATLTSATLAGVSLTSTTLTSITLVDTAIKNVNTTRATLGSHQNRLEHIVNNLGTTSENLSASESRIRDVDMAQEMMEYTKDSILSQAATAMLAQANQAPQGVLQLLR